jgi:hypothetical protein
MQQVAEGLSILCKYLDGDPVGSIGAEYEAIHCDGPDEEDLSPEDRKKLKELGWFLSEEENEGWTIFV